MSRLIPYILACPVCFQVDDGPSAAGVRAAVLVLAGVTVLVLGALWFHLGGRLRRD